MSDDETERVTSEQAQAAKWLVNDAGTYAPLIPLIGQMSADVTERLAAAHDAVGFGCSATSEGMTCCIDVLLSDPADYAPEKVAEARAVLARWQEQLHEAAAAEVSPIASSPPSR